MTLEEKIHLHKEISLKIEELEQQKKALGQEIMSAMTSKTLQIDNYFVRRCSRLSISMTIDQARSFNATRQEEVVDKEKVKVLYQSGTSVPGVKEIEYIQITIKAP